MQRRNVSLTELTEEVESSAIYYVGTTIRPTERAAEHSRRFPDATMMLFANTSNMNKAENVLLGICSIAGQCRKNIQKTSNARKSPGYVYAI